MKNKKKRNKKYKQSYKSERQDYRQGGRVQKAKGGVNTKPTEPDDILNKINKPNRPITEPIVNPIDKPVMPPVDNGQMSIGGVGGNDNATPEPTPVGTTTPETQETQETQETPTAPETTSASPQAMRTTTKEGDLAFDEARQERIRETGLQIEASATGNVPDAVKIPAAMKVGVDAEGKPLKGQQQQTTAMQDVEGYVDTTATATTAQQVTEEGVTTGEVKEAPTPETITAAEITKDELDIVPEETKVDAAKGVIDEDKALAKAAGVDRVEPIDAAEVKIPEGALTERVIGTLSEGAKATAAINAGTSLSRITRAKKQLSRAGLSDEDIAEIGNDPEALEDRLADFSEEQRGIIEGLPEEALVSTQINGLLEGVENGEIPLWAKPAVASVEAMLAQRGMSASTVGRDALLNTIIQAAMPIAQSNAQAIQSSVAQQRDIEARESEANAQRRQQTALDNANKVFNMDMAQFNSDQQIALSNSKFLQTVGLTEANNQQQAVIQDALLMSQANLAEADFYQKTQIQNAQSFLQMDMANLNNKQQSNILKAQQQQQRVLSNQAAQNVAAQFNATSENQTNQFMANMNAQINQYNSSQMNAMEQFNSTQKNAAEARRAGRDADIEKFNAQLTTQVDQFNAQQDFARNQWNAQNSAAIEASNVQWRRQTNTVNTAAQNTINMQNSQNAYGMTMQSQAFLWQELRDQADFNFRGFENEQNRQAQIISTAIANEGDAGKTYDDYLTGLVSSLSTSFSRGYSGSGSGGYGGGYGGGGSGSGTLQK